MANNSFTSKYPNVGLYLNEGLLGYLSPEARLAFDGFVTAGMDQDLAVAVVEYILPETKVWALPIPEKLDLSNEEHHPLT